MTRRVVITGLGVISSIGIGWEEFWDNLLQGKSGISPITAFDTTNHFTHNGGEARGFHAERFIAPERLKLMNRATQMAVAAAQLAVNDAGLTPGYLSGITVGVSHGTTLGAAQAMESVDRLLIDKQEVNANLLYQMPTHTSPAAIAREFNCTGPHFMVSTACAAGNYAIAYAYDQIIMNRANLMIAGAADGITRTAYTGFNQFKAIAPERCQPFDKNRKGMIPGEGAGILILESIESARKRKAPIYAEIAGYGLSCDAHHMTSATVSGIAACMTKALRSAGIDRERVEYISAHGTGTLANDRAECAAIKEVFGPRHQIPISSIKSMLGHTMGAASALEAITCVLVVQRDIVPPTINFETADEECGIDCVPNETRKQPVTVALNNAYAFGGNNACLVLKKFPDRGGPDSECI
jgi:3-oxoacyl-[acyl-carrier-protein] synthase II